MIPAGAIGALVAAGLRSARSGRRNAQNRGLSPARPLGLGAAAVLFVVAMGYPQPAWIVPLWVGFALALSIGAPALPTALFVRLGWVRPTLALWRVSGHWNRTTERRQAAAFHAARALLRAPSEDGAAVIERYLQGCVELATSGAAATALIALARGDRARAVAILRAFDGVGAGEIEGRLWLLGFEVRALDAAAAGDWRVLAEPRVGLKSSRLTRLLACAARFTLAPAGSVPPSRVWLAWALAPHRRRTRPFVRATLERPPLPPPALPAPSFAAHAALLARVPGEVRAADVGAAVRSLALVRGSGRSLAELQRRALTLGATADAAQIHARVCDEAEAELARIVLDERLPLAWLGPPADTASAASLEIEALRSRIFDERLERAEALARGLGRRALARIDLPEGDEWRSWGDLRGALDDLVRDAATPAERDAVFRAVFHPLTSYAVRLCNVRSRRVLARFVFATLRDLGRLAEAGDDATLCEKNAFACEAEFLGVAVLDGEPLSHPPSVKRRRRVEVVQLVVGITIAFGPLYLEGSAWSELATHAKVTMFVLGVTALVFSYLNLRGIVDVTRVGESIVLQTNQARFPAQVGDIVGARPGRRSRVHLELRRRPRWMTRRPVTMAASPADARAVAARINALCAEPPR